MRSDDQVPPVQPPVPEILLEFWPDGRELLSALTANRFYEASTEPGASLFDSLYRVLSFPRMPGLNPWNICQSLLTRILAPATNTQKIAVPFSTGTELSSTTCFVAARIYELISRAPAEYARWVEQLTSPALQFFVTRVFADPTIVAAAARELGRYCQVVRLGARTLRLFLPVDPDCINRAIVEQFHVRPCLGEGSQETRHVIDVLLQSALMNFLMAGAYSSATDSHRITGERGVASDDDAVILLDNIILRAAGGSSTVLP